MKPRESCAD